MLIPTVWTMGFLRCHHTSDIPSTEHQQPLSTCVSSSDVGSGLCSPNWLCQGCPPIELVITPSEEMAGCRMILPSALVGAESVLFTREGTLCVSRRSGAHKSSHGHDTGAPSDRRSRFVGVPQRGPAPSNGNTSACFSIPVAHVESPGSCKVLNVNLSTEVKCICFSHRGIPFAFRLLSFQSQRFTILPLVNRKSQVCGIRKPQQIQIERCHWPTQLSFCSWQLSRWSRQPAGPNGMVAHALSALLFLSEKVFPFALEGAFFLGHRGMSSG